jgi:UPF0755 protein
MYKRKIGLAIVLFIAAFGLYFTYTFYRVFFLPNTTFNNETSYIFISTGSDIDALLIELAPLIKSTDDFRLAAEKKGYASRIRAGKYALIKGMSNNDIINHLRGKSLSVKVTFNNQERLEDLAGRLAQQLEADSLAFLTQMREEDFLAKNGFDQATALAMYIPNTYEFFWNVSPQYFQKRMLKQYEYFWTPKRRNAAQNQGLTPNEVSTLAAIVQKESLKNDERPLIAQVYLNRLKKKMRLQADPTVIYSLRKEQDDFSLVIRRVLRKDLKIESPYNTYRTKGLPPGPIAMPDISAIDAVLFPTPHKYLYFVSDPNKQGYHDFSTSLREHNRKARKYYRWLNQQKLYR